ncbi:hypothetical protein D3C73_1652240 [compost metagenome]
MIALHGINRYSWPIRMSAKNVSKLYWVAMAITVAAAVSLAITKALGVAVTRRMVLKAPKIVTDDM